ncbi:RibD family protein [Roseococcus sp. DSY-14]|uniref:RibD family protein n=1 Tax=Roseococcus sp. DSY-14 TaxID=3369650 RepID=UPI00387B5E6C
MDGAPPDAEWQALLAGEPSRAGSLAPLFAPVLAPGGCVVGRLAQTLDGRIATRAGHSQWIGGAGDLRHTHRLRALCQAVVVGAGTVREDDPRLSTRLVPGPSPLRVVIDPRRRLPAHHRVFSDGAPSLLVATTPGPATHGTAEVLELPAPLDLAALLAALRARGCARIFVEGGGQTVSRFLLAGLLDRLHVTVAPMILGSGRPAFDLPEVATVHEGLRFAWTPHPIEPDMLFDVALR